MTKSRCRPGQVRDAIVEYLAGAHGEARAGEIERAVTAKLGCSSSSVRSYLLANTPTVFSRPGRGLYGLRVNGTVAPPAAKKKTFPAIKLATKARLFHADCFDWLASQARESYHAVVTDPPYGLVEYSAPQQAKMRNGNGGVWRIPPSVGGYTRSPVPRFTVLDDHDLDALETFFSRWAGLLLPALVPGANVIVASQPLLSHRVVAALVGKGFEIRGSIIRLVTTMRGGDRPKNAHKKFKGVTVMPRSMWEPWLVFRKPIMGRVQDNLRQWETGGFRRPSADRPFGDVIKSAPTQPAEKAIARHPSLKPQAFLRQIVRAVLPLKVGTVLDCFAGSCSTLAACAAVGYECVGVEVDRHYVKVGKGAFSKLRDLQLDQVSK